MASYTIELRKICDLYGRNTVENWFKDYNINDYLTSSQIETITEAGLWTKEKLATKIVDHYFMREIGFETPALFEHFVKVKMKEIMEEKLPLIYTNSIEYNPLINVDFTETFERTQTAEGRNEENLSSRSVSNGTANGTSSNTGTSNSESSNNSSSLNVHSVTPQGKINKQHVLNGTYSSDVSANENETTIEDETTTSSQTTNSSTSSDTINNTAENELNSENNIEEQYTKHLTGNQGISATYQAMIKQFRENIVAVDKDIINELNSLFMGIY